MKRLSKFNAVLLSLVLAVIAVFCGFFMTACKDDNGGGNNGDNAGENSTPVNAPESKPLSLTSSVVTNDSGENVYTINAIVNPDTLTPRWAIVWENPDSEWASGKNVNDYINLELSNGDKTAKLSTKQAFGETAILTATIGQGASAVSVSKKMDYALKLEYELNSDGASYRVVGYKGNCDVFSIGIPDHYLNLPVTHISPAAFRGSSIEHLVLPSTIKFVGVYAFYGCENLKSVKIDCVGNVQFGYGCFAYCSNLSYFYLNCESTSSYQGTMAEFKYVLNFCGSGVNCGGIDFCIGEKLTRLFFIGSTMYREGQVPILVKSVDLSRATNLTKIGSSAFAFTTLSNITIPASVTEISGWAFRSCSSLTNVTFLGDKSKISIASNAFEGCPYQP